MTLSNAADLLFIAQILISQAVIAWIPWDFMTIRQIRKAISQ